MAIVQAIQNGHLVDTSASSTSTSSSSKTTQAGSSLDKDAFLQLLVAQMKYQDPLQPTDNTEYVSQLATFSQLEGTNNMQSTLQQMEANNLVGKQVILKVTSKTTGETSYVSGQVDYVIHENGGAFLSVNDKLYSINDLDTVADSKYMDAVSLAKGFATTMASLPSVTNLTVSDESKLTSARKAYDALTDYQKQFVNGDIVKNLEKLEERMKVLKGDAESSTDKTEDKTEEKTENKTEGTGDSKKTS